uniref:Uncharacterized protein n=1 Tax=Myoviridae sp. ctBtT5 TaxID=2825048 RepID=A0A8S5Q091_9CAUD|nr:MAG TPA: hypothetical protein [Myoviridae sp. ctBtT5]
MSNLNLLLRYIQRLKNSFYLFFLHCCTFFELLLLYLLERVQVVLHHSLRYVFAFVCSH